MGLLDDVKPPYVPPVYRDRRSRMTEEQRLAELNNLDRDEVTEDFEDSPFADRE